MDPSSGRHGHSYSINSYLDEEKCGISTVSPFSMLNANNGGPALNIDEESCQSRRPISYDVERPVLCGRLLPIAPSLTWIYLRICLMRKRTT